MEKKKHNQPPDEEETPEGKLERPESTEESPKEFGGQEGPDPTRYGDWEKGGRCIDF